MTQGYACNTEISTVSNAYTTLLAKRSIEQHETVNWSLPSNSAKDFILILNTDLYYSEVRRIALILINSCVITFDIQVGMYDGFKMFPYEERQYAFSGETTFSFTFSYLNNNLSITNNNSSGIEYPFVIRYR